MKMFRSLKGMKYILILMAAVVILLFSIVVMTQTTMSRYTEERVAYTSFGIADFNVALSPGANGADTAVTKLSGQRFYPGMTWTDDSSTDTSACLPFNVSNGTAGAASDVGLKYTVRLRTAQSLPLSFVLGVYEEATTAADGSVTEAGWKYYRSLPEATLLEDSNANNEKRYEYSFSPVEAGSEPAPAPLAAGDTATEPEFRIERSFDGNKEEELKSIQHRLFIEWPIGENGENSIDYMKEVELIELVVTATSLNMLDTEDYYKVIAPGDVTPEYTGGILLMLPPYEGSTANYVYTVDLRAFELGESGGEFDFALDNAVSFRVEQPADTITYGMQLKIPAEAVIASDGTESMRIMLMRCETDEDGNQERGYNIGRFTEYRLYNEKTGDYKDDKGETLSYATMNEVPEIYRPGYTVPEAGTEEGAEAVEKPDPEFRLYAIYTAIPEVGSNVLYNKEISTGGETKNAPDRHNYVLCINGSAVTAENIAKICFDSKIELLVSAQFSMPAGGTPPDPAPEGEGEEIPDEQPEVLPAEPTE